MWKKKSNQIGNYTDVGISKKKIIINTIEINRMIAHVLLYMLYRLVGAPRAICI